MRVRSFALLLLIPALPSILLAQTPIPSVTDIEADFTAQKYQDVIRKSSAALQVRQALVGPDRVAVLEIKAESHLRLKQYTPAADAYLLALKEVEPDSLAGAKYQSTARLLKGLTSTGQYQPKPPAPASPGERPPRPAPISVVEPADRELALLAFYEDERRSIDSAIEQLGRQRNLQLLESTISKVDDLRILELAATGSEINSKTLREPIATQAALLLNAPLEQLSEKIEHAQRLASRDRTMAQTVTPTGVRQDVAQKVGLTAPERAEMQNVARDLNTIVAKAEELGKRLDVSLDPPSGSRRGRSNDPPTLGAVHAEAAEQLKEALGVLDANYVSTPVNATRGRSTRPIQGGQ